MVSVGYADSSIGRATEQLINDVDQLLKGKKRETETAEDKLLIAIAWGLPKGVSLGKKEAEAVAKAYNAVMDGPLAHCKHDVEYYEKATKFFRGQEGVDWCKCHA